VLLEEVTGGGPEHVQLLCGLGFGLLSFP
jgi:hypothetical protein